MSQKPALGKRLGALPAVLFTVVFLLSLLELIRGVDQSLIPISISIAAFAGAVISVMLARLLVQQRDELVRRRQAEATHQTAREQLSLLLDHVDVGIALTNEQHRIIEANRAMGKLYRTDADTLPGHTTGSLDVGPSIIEGHQEAEVMRGDGTLFTALEKSFPLKDATGKISGYVKMVEDITSRKEAEEERLKLERKLQNAAKQESLSTLAEGISNDFNNLLMAVLGNADLAGLKLERDHPAQKFLGNIEDAARRATALCKQMSAFSGRDRNMVEPLNLARLIQETMHILQVSVSKNTKLRFHFDDQLPLIEGDTFQIRQAVVSLVTNASESLGKKTGMVSITTGTMQCSVLDFNEPYLDHNLPAGEYVYFEVADTGSGMTTEVRERIFDPFFTTKYERKGLGMAGALSIARGHRGAIKIFSEPGRGTTVRVLFPPSQVQEEPQQIPQSGKEAFRGEGSFLIIDDEATVRGLTEVMLARMGFKVLLAEDGVEGLELYERHRENIRGVVLDMVMPRMDGRETFRRLREMNPHLPIILISGQESLNTPENRELFANANLLHKPFQINQLRACVRKAMGA